MSSGGRGPGGRLRQPANEVSLKIHVLTLFPGLFDSFLSYSMMKRAIAKKRVEVMLHDLRDFTHDRHRTCDDRPFGGGPGMLMKPEPIFEAADSLGWSKKKKDKRTRFIYLSPQGRPFRQQTAQALARCRELIFLCGHYEGVDERVIDGLVTDEISVGDYVLTQGELPAMVVMDAVIRLLKGVVGNEASKSFESFSKNLIEYPQYTRPAVYRGHTVPAVLVSGDHQKIGEWQHRQATRRTLKRRPDLLADGARRGTPANRGR